MNTFLIYWDNFFAVHQTDNDATAVIFFFSFLIIEFQRRDPAILRPHEQSLKRKAPTAVEEKS